MKVLILVGFPGSGKSTHAKSLEADYTIINQDTLGNRKKCVQAAINALKEGKSIVIDRTNINKKQRKIWIDLAKEYKVDKIELIEFRCSSEECIKRVAERKDHPTIKDFSIDKITFIVRKFEDDYEEPHFSEGFDSHTVYYQPIVFKDFNRS